MTRAPSTGVSSTSPATSSWRPTLWSCWATSVTHPAARSRATPTPRFPWPSSASTTLPRASPPPAPDPSGDDSKNSVTVGGPTLTSFSAPRLFSPNGDGRQDTFRISARLSSPAQWLLTISDAQGTPWSTDGGNGDAIDVDWDG